MGKMYLKMLLVLLGIGFCIFLGVDIATRGVERIQGPIGHKTTVSAAADADKGKNAQQTGKPLDGKAIGTAQGGKSTKTDVKVKPPQEEVEAKENITETSGINQFGNKMGELLQIVAHHGIRWFVSLFDAITG